MVVCRVWQKRGDQKGRAEVLSHPSVTPEQDLHGPSCILLFICVSCARVALLVVIPVVAELSCHECCLPLIHISHLRCGVCAGRPTPQAELLSSRSSGSQR